MTDPDAPQLNGDAPRQIVFSIYADGRTNLHVDPRIQISELAMLAMTIGYLIDKRLDEQAMMQAPQLVRAASLDGLTQ